jgi:putative membrane protein
MTDANILAALDEANVADSSTGALAASKGTNADVRSFGRQMVNDHHAMRKQGADLAKKLNITPQPPADDHAPADAKSFQDSLTAMAKGAAWDKAYVDHEVADHEEVLKKAQDMSAAAQNQELKDLIAKAAPKVQEHLDKAKSIQSKLAKP